MIETFGFLSLALLMACPSPQASAPRTEITRDEARQVVLKVLESEGIDVNSPDLLVEDQPDDKDFRGYYLFSAFLYSNLGPYAVDRKTAEVWDPFICIHYKYKGVRALQKSLRKEIGLTDRAYRKLAAQRPFCFLVPVKTWK